VSPTSPRDPSRRPPPIGVRFAAWIAELPLTRDAHHVALTMARYMNGGGEVRVGVPRIARDSKVPERTVKYARHELERLGILVVARPGGGRERPTEYRINGAALARFEASNGADGAPLGADTVRDTVRDPAPNGAGDDANGAAPAPEEVGRGLEEEEKTRAGAPEAPRAIEIDPAAVAEAWHLYRDPASPAYVRKAARKTIVRAGDGALLEREEEQEWRALEAALRERGATAEPVIERTGDGWRLTAYGAAERERILALLHEEAPPEEASG